MVSNGRPGGFGTIADGERIKGTRVSNPRKFSELVMYPWPLGEFDNVMDLALDIAMDYLDRTGQAKRFKQAQFTAAEAIAAAWQVGVRHRIKLANIAIRAVERKLDG
jgi:hypothetical protein